MSDTKWTKEQLDAITKRDCNLLVAAAAGSGKTAVLVERIIKKITDIKRPVDIDRLLVVTFTNAAATEMRERIAEALSKELEANPGSKVLQRQLTLLGKSSITTMHSFCLEVIRNNIQNLELDPNFRIANETECTLLKLEALDELLESVYENESLGEEFFELLECYGGNRDDQAIADMILNLFEFVQSYPWTFQWLDNMTEMFKLSDDYDFLNTQWGRVIVSSTSIELSGVLEKMGRAIETARFAEGLEPYLPVLMEEYTAIEKLTKICGCAQRWNDLYNAFSNIEFVKLPNCKKNADKTKQEFVKGIRDNAKKLTKKMCEDLFNLSSEEILKDLTSLYPMIKCLSNLVKDFSNRYALKKRQKLIVDFNDLEHLCLNILTETDEAGKPVPSRVAHDYRKKFEEILVDEYQDSNLIQEIIVGMASKADSETPNMFMVGDVKQSIYRFRQAKPEIFLEKYNRFSLEEGKDIKIKLFKNFRSRKEVIESVNFIFKQIMSATVGEIDYNNDEKLNLGAEYSELTEEASITGGATELHLIETNGLSEQYPDLDDEAETTYSEEEEMTDSIRCEAKAVAKRIKQLLSPDKDGKYFKVYDKSIKGYRKVEYKDIVILLRTTMNWTDTFVEEMSSAGMPVFADTATGFFKTTEVQIILSLLQVIDNPLQDIPLLSVLRSPIAALTPDELADIRLADKNASIFEALIKLTETGDGTVPEKCREFRDNLEKWRNKSLYMSTDELIWYLYNETGFYSFAGAMPGGNQRQANLRILFERARQFEETSFKGLFNFINYINKLKSSKGDMGSAKILGENENVIRIMSIHKSKGLEFPVVFVSGCGKQFNMQDMNKKMLLHQDIGFGPDFVDYKRRLTYASLPKQAVRHKIKVETLSEEMRVLYVALTRAREKLIITGCVDNIENTVKKWADIAAIDYEKLPFFDMLHARKYLDWLGPALIRHQDCALLRECIGMEKYYELSDSSIWSIRFWRKDEIIATDAIAVEEQEKNVLWCDDIDINTKYSPHYEEINRRLDWKYSYKKAAAIPAKVSVTELKKRFTPDNEDDVTPFNAYSTTLVKKPSFMDEDIGLNSAQSGSVLHFVMQHLDLSYVYAPDPILKQVDKMVEMELLTRQQADTVDYNKIHAFFCSELGQEMLGAKEVNREVPFNIEVSAKELFNELQDQHEDETVLLQGVIDCYFETENGLVLLDYKTDFVPKGDKELLRERYRLQIEYYALALEKLTGRRIKGKYIYLFWNGQMLEYL